MNKNQKSLLLVFAACIIWGSLAASWYGGDNLEPAFVVAWSIVASFAVMFTGWATWMVVTYRPKFVPVLIRPRNRRIR